MTALLLVSGTPWHNWLCFLFLFMWWSTPSVLFAVSGPYNCVSRDVLLVIHCTCSVGYGLVLCLSTCILQSWLLLLVAEAPKVSLYDWFDISNLCLSEVGQKYDCAGPLLLEPVSIKGWDTRSRRLRRPVHSYESETFVLPLRTTRCSVNTLSFTNVSLALDCLGFFISLIYELLYNTRNMLITTVLWHTHSAEQYIVVQYVLNRSDLTCTL
jgi:hypothetical protein